MGYQFRRIQSHATNNHSDIADGCVREDMPTSVAEKVSKEPEEGSPEYIQRKYFLSAPADDPSLVWLIPYRSAGTPIPPSVNLSLPTHLGLHHQAEGSRAGYTLDELLLLTRSSVRVQRSTTLEVLDPGMENLRYLLLQYTSILAKMH